jgi:hypothetical protein
VRNRIREALIARTTRFLDQPVGHYEQNHPNDVELLHGVLRKGDVVLVEGDQRISLIIQFLTHSPWSHAALYVGDELIRHDGPLRDLALEHFGEDAGHLVVEALMDGVVASPLSKYTEHNLRLCRPHRLRAPDLQYVVDQAVASIGLRYDLRNVVELAVYLLGLTLVPARFRRRALRFGSGSSGEVICSSLLGRLFAEVGFPVLPSVSHPKAPGGTEHRRNPLLSAWSRRRARRASVYRRRHPTLLMPRDFDISPFFEVVKWNVVAQRGFDYARIEWEEDETDAPAAATKEEKPEQA